VILQDIGVYFFDSPMGAFLRAQGTQKPGFPLQIRKPCTAILAGFPL
jgi:hypothetical protein